LKFYQNKEKCIVESGLLDCSLINGYEAIYSETNKTIECQLSLIESEYEYLHYFQSDFNPCYDENGVSKNPPPDTFEIENSFGVDITIGCSSRAFNALTECKGLSIYNKNPQYTLKISNIHLNDYEDALENLTKIGLSVLFSISKDFQISIILKNDQPSRIAFPAWVYDVDSALLSDAKLSNITKHYDTKPLSYLLNANVCNEMPLYQFLQFYHCIEYYFTKHAGSSIKKNIIDTISKYADSHDNFSDIERALIETFKKKVYLKEEQCLKDVFNDCIDAQNIDSYITNRDELKSYFLDTKDYESISLVDLYKTESISLDILAKRIYEIRNSIVHAKSDERIIEINEHNMSLIMNDIKLIKYIAEQVLIKNSL
jgi:hypothetical protein